MIESSPLSSESDDYESYSINNAKCLILCYSEFGKANKITQHELDQVQNKELLSEEAEKKFSLPPLYGNLQDAQKVEDTFRMFNFEIDKCQDFNFKDTEKFIKKNRDDLNNNDYDCLVVYITSHGRPGYFNCDDKQYPMAELFNEFDAFKCPKMIDKPKCFIIDTCLGKKSNYAMKEQNVKTTQKSKKISVPSTADFLCIYATNVGNPAHYDKITGSWFTKQFCETLLDYSHKMDLVSILTIVNRKVAEMTSVNQTKQMPFFKSTLRKFINLNIKTQFTGALCKVIENVEFYERISNEENENEENNENNENNQNEGITNKISLEVNGSKFISRSHNITVSFNSNFVIRELEPNVFKSVFDYSMGNVSINDQNVPGLFAISMIHGIEHLQEICEKYLCQKLSTATAANIFFLADKYSSERLVLKSLKYIMITYIKKMDEKISVADVYMVLHYLKDETVSINFEYKNARCVLAISNIFGIGNLKQICEDYLVNNLIIGISNAVEQYIFAYTNDAVKLKTKIVKYIKNNKATISKTEQYRKLIESNKEYLRDIYDRDDLETEIIFKIGEHTFKFNRWLFRQSAPIIESKLDGNVFELEGIEPKHFEKLLEYIEHDENVEMDEETAIAILLFSDDYSDVHLKNSILNYIGVKYEDIEDDISFKVVGQRAELLKEYIKFFKNFNKTK